MSVVRGIRTGLKIAGRIDQKYNINKIFVNKYVPPGYRKLTNRIFDIVGTAGGGYGLYQGLSNLIADDSPGNPIAIQTPKFRKQYATRTSYKTRRRQSVCYTTRRSKRYSVN